MKNQFYNRSSFCLIKVKFSECVDPYTYAAHKKYDLQVGDVVVVPVGNEEFTKDEKGGYQFMKPVRVCGITNDMRHIPQEYPLKHIISKVDVTFHDKILRAKRKYINAHSRKSTKRL